jgi:hypothetical protein
MSKEVLTTHEHWKEEGRQSQGILSHVATPTGEIATAAAEVTIPDDPPEIEPDVELGYN